MSQQSLFRLDGQSAAVVGAGSGIGEAVALVFAQQGAHVACLDLDPGKARSTADRIAKADGSAEAGAVDIRDGAAVQAALDDLEQRRGRLDVVVCTPSINVRKTLLSYSEEEFEKVVSVNLKGNFNVLRAAARIMTKQKGGSIILFSSIRSLVVEPGQAVYAATKAGIVQLVRTAAAELGPAGVRVNAVAPGVVDTPLTAPIKSDESWYQAYAARNALKRWATPSEIAAPTVLLASAAGSYMTGAVLFVDGGWTAIDGRFHPPGM